MSKAIQDTTKISRRAAVGLSLGGALAIAGGAALASEPDPIYAAIAAHRVAVDRFSKAVDVTAPMRRNDPGFEAADAEVGEASEAMDQAGEVLTSIIPETMAGIMALLGYVQEVIVTHSDAIFPAELADDEVLNARGYPLNAPFPYWIMKNVREALTHIGGLGATGAV